MTLRGSLRPLTHPVGHEAVRTRLACQLKSPEHFSIRYASVESRVEGDCILIGVVFHLAEKEQVTKVGRYWRDPRRHHQWTHSDLRKSMNHALGK